MTFRSAGERPWPDCRHGGSGWATAGNAPGLGCSPVGLGFEHVDDEAAQRLRDVADRVLAILAAAGIPVSASENPGPDGGAVVTVDTGADEVGGVYVAWQLPRVQHDLLLSCLQAGLRSHPAAQYSFEVWRAMREAIIAILNAAGLAAARSEDRNDIDPLKVLVSG
jgi:hypothetical protein